MLIPKLLCANNSFGDNMKVINNDDIVKIFFMVLFTLVLISSNSCFVGRVFIYNNPARGTIWITITWILI